MTTRRAKKKCELCDCRANMYCESDEASLCWNCDANVHSANFIVAKHSRTLLCHVCQSPTPWNASGHKLGPTILSLCQNCIINTQPNDEQQPHHVNHEDDDEPDDDRDDDGGSPGEDDGGDNQVVPLSPPPPPSVSSSSTSEDSWVGG